MPHRQAFLLGLLDNRIGHAIESCPGHRRIRVISRGKQIPRVSGTGLQGNENIEHLSRQVHIVRFRALRLSDPSVLRRGAWRRARRLALSGDLRDQCDLLASRKRSQRSIGSRRSAPWNGSTHPGYSGGRALASSNCLSSFWVSVRSTAARLS